MDPHSPLDTHTPTELPLTVKGLHELGVGYFIAGYVLFAKDRGFAQPKYSKRRTEPFLGCLSHS